MEKLHFVLIVFLLLMFTFPYSFSEISGTINSSGNITVVTGLFGYTVSTCTPQAGCMDYKCFFDFDNYGNRTTTTGFCNLSSITSCYHDESDYKVTIIPTDGGWCNGTTYFRRCTNGVWDTSWTACASGTNCTTGATPCIAPTTDGGGGGGGGGATTNKSISITSTPGTIEIVQGRYSSTSVTIKNTGNTTLVNITLNLTGVSSSWYSFAPSLMTLSSNNSNSFSITFNIPQDAEVKSYAINITVTAKDGTTKSATMTLNVLPSEQTTIAINQTLSNYLLLLTELEQNITSLETRGANKNDTDNLKLLFNNTRDKLQAANASIVQSNYFNAKLLLDEAKNLLDSLSQQISQVIIPEETAAATDFTMIIIIIVVVVIVVVLAYLLWPIKRERKLLEILREK